MKPKISVIVPVYGVERYLPQCVESILSQSERDLEVILVEDGSPDNCGPLCDAFARRDGRVRVIHQKNAGLGPARNAGLEAAAGEYIAFVDGDDFLLPRMYETLREAAERTGADITVSGHRDVAFGSVLTVKPHPLAGKTLKGEEILPVRCRLYGHGPGERGEAFPMSVCMSLYRKKLLEEKGLRFLNILSEDTLFNLEAYGNAGSITFTASADYCYRKENQSSITASFSPDKGERYREFLTVLRRMAQRDSEGCVLRARRTAVDYGRMYAALVEASDLPVKEKCRCLREFSQRTSFLWEGCPWKELPWQQRIFHKALANQNAMAVLALCRVRRSVKKGERKHGKP